MDKCILIYPFLTITRKQVDKQHLLLSTLPIYMNCDHLSVIYPTAVAVGPICPSASGGNPSVCLRGLILHHRSRVIRSCPIVPAPFDPIPSFPYRRFYTTRSSTICFRTNAPVPSFLYHPSRPRQKAAILLSRESRCSACGMRHFCHRGDSGIT